MIACDFRGEYNQLKKRVNNFPSQSQRDLKEFSRFTNDPIGWFAGQIKQFLVQLNKSKSSKFKIHMVKIQLIEPFVG